MTADIKLALLFSGCLMVLSFCFVAIMMHSIGTISNLLSHMDETFRKESDLRESHYTAMLRQNKLRLVNQIEHERRQEALLAIPLVRSSGPKLSKN